MRIMTVLLRGRFEDAFLYRGHLIVLTEEHTLRFYSIDELVRILNSQSKSSIPIPTFMFSRNDWLSSEIFNSLMKRGTLADEFLREFDYYSSPFLEVPDFSRSHIIEEDIPTHSSYILDIEIYNGRLYLGADNGLFSVDLIWSKDDISLMGVPSRRTETRCIDLNIRYGALLISCGEEGLHTYFDEFGWANGQVRENEMTIGVESIRTGWFNHAIFNYSSSVYPDLFTTDYRKVSREGYSNRIEKERSVILGINHHPVSSEKILTEEISKQGSGGASIFSIYNSNNFIFVNMTDGKFYTASVQELDSGIGYKKIRSYNGPDGKVLSMHPLGYGVISETYDRIWAFSSGEWQTILSAKALSVRTFPRSKRYRNIVTVTAEEGVYLSGVWDDHIFFK